MVKANLQFKSLYTVMSEPKEFVLMPENENRSLSLRDHHFTNVIPLKALNTNVNTSFHTYHLKVG